MLTNLTIKSAAALLQSGQTTSVALTQHFLDRIATLDPQIGAYLRTTPEIALAQAKASDERRAAGQTLGVLDGIPYGVKDVIMTKGIETTAASKILEGFIAPYNATVVARLEEQGAVMLGKLNCDEFAMGSSTENSAYQLTRNPWDVSKVPGGSSGGSAAALSADLAIFTLGTDTGGSIRQPASFCSVTGIKPTYGRVSRHGAIPYGSSLDQIGPMAKCIEDLDIMLSVMAGSDGKDATCVGIPYLKSNIENRKSSSQIANLKIGLPREYFGKGLDPAVQQVVDQAVATYKELGAEIIEVSLPHTAYAIPTYYLIVMAEMSSNLARYDGIHYGNSVLRTGESVADLSEVYLKTRSQFFGDEAKRKILLGTFELSAGYYDAYYKRAMKSRTLIKRDFDEVFKTVDVLLTPVSPIPPFAIGEKKEDPLSMYLADIYTVPANLAGVTALSLPAGFTPDNLPVGIQLIGPAWGEAKLLSVAHQFEQATDFHTKFPQL